LSFTFTQSFGRELVPERTFIKAGSRYEYAIARNPIAPAASAQVIGMCIRKDCALDRLPGVDEKALLLAEEANVGHTQQWISVQAHVSRIELT
jgi:hypothetical protein